jgi:hypothetical protein
MSILVLFLFLLFTAAVTMNLTRPQKQRHIKKKALASVFAMQGIVEHHRSALFRR